MLVNRYGRCTTAATPIAELVGRVADDYVELHLASKQLGDPSVDVVGVDECIGMGFKIAPTIKCALAGTAERAAPVLQRVFDALKPDVSVLVRECGCDGVRSICQFRAVDSSTR